MIHYIQTARRPARGLVELQDGAGLAGAERRSGWRLGKSERPPSVQGPHLKTQYVERMPHKPKQMMSYGLGLCGLSFVRAWRGAASSSSSSLRWNCCSFSLARLARHIILVISWYVM